MSLTQSTMLELGTQAPNFTLPDVTTNKKVSLSDILEKNALLVIFLCRHCPFVQHVKDEIAKIGKDYADKNLSILAISSNNAEAHPQDSPDSLAEMAQNLDLNFPLLYDETQEVAKKYTAACTPDFFLFDQEKNLTYRGRLDDSRPSNNKPINGKDLRNAINKVLKGEKPSKEQAPSSGCNIKWKPGNEPNYY